MTLLYKKQAALYGLLAAVIFMAVPQTGAAATNCDFAGQFKTLAAAQKTAASGRMEDFLAELSVRKKLIRNVLDCGEADAKKLQAKLGEISEADADVRMLKKQHAGKLDEALQYYAFQRNRVNDLGAQGSRDMARAVLEWRSGNYAPLAGSIGNLMLWLRNQELFSVAQNRLTQVTKSLQGLDLDTVENIQNLLGEARENLDAAKVMNGEARTALIERAATDHAAATLRDSLDALALTYENFFDISEAVKKLVPL